MPILTIPTLGQYGLVADQPAHELPENAFSSVSNVRFRGGMAERINGSRTYVTPSFTPYWCGFYATGTTRYVVHAGLALVKVYDGTSSTDITGTAPTGAIDDRWTGGVLNGVLILNNGVDQPMYWGGTGTLATLTGWNANWRAKSIRPYKNALVALGVTKSGTYYPHMVKTSSLADPGSVPASWDETDPAVDTYENDHAETTDHFVDQLVLGDVNILYKESSIYVMRLTQGQDVYTIQRLPGTYGMLARGCAADTPKGHVVLANGDVILHQGIAEPVSILSNTDRRWLFETQIDSAYSQRCFVVSNPSKEEVLICYPEIGQSVCTKALVWNWSTGAFGVRDLQSATYGASGLITYAAGDTYDSATETYDTVSRAYNQNDFTPNDPRLIMAELGPKLTLQDSGTTLSGSAISWSIERTGLAFGDTDSVKTITSLTPRAIAANGTQFYIQVGGSMDAETSPTWSDAVLYTTGSSLKAYTFATGRYLAYRIYGTQSQPIKFKSLDFEIQKTGRY